MISPIDRRDFMRGTAAFTALPFAGLARAAAAETDLVARKVFFDNPDVGSLRISPDGQNLAGSRRSTACAISGWRHATTSAPLGRVQPVGDDFKGSSLKVETGGELVPGLAG